MVLWFENYDGYTEINNYDNLGDIVLFVENFLNNRLKEIKNKNNNFNFIHNYNNTFFTKINLDYDYSKKIFMAEGDVRIEGEIWRKDTVDELRETYCFIVERY